MLETDFPPCSNEKFLKTINQNEFNQAITHDRAKKPLVQAETY